MQREAASDAKPAGWPALPCVAPARPEALSEWKLATLWSRSAQAQWGPFRQASRCRNALHCKPPEIRRMRRFKIAPFDRIDQGARRCLRRNAEVAAQQIRELPCPAQRGLASLVARKQHQPGTLSILARRLQRNQPFSRRNGALAIAIRIGVPAKRLEHGCRCRCKPLSLVTMPGIELFDVQSEVRQKRPAPKFCGPGEFVQRGRSSKRCKRPRIHREELSA